MIFFPFRDRWYLSGCDTMDTELVNKDENEFEDSRNDADEQWPVEEGETKVCSNNSNAYRDKSEGNDVGVSIFKKCFDFISAVDYLDINGEPSEPCDITDSIRLPNKKSSCSMFEELLKCLEGKTRTDFYTWEDVLSGRKDSTKILLSRGFSINGTDREGDTLLHYACRIKDKAMMTELFEKGACILVNKKLESPLHVSVSNCDVDITRILLENEACVNCVDKLGYAPLHLAAKNDNEKLVDILLKNGADASAKTDCNLQPIHFAIKNKRVLELLIREKVDLNSASSDGSTPLHFATRGNSYESIELLLKNKARVNMKDINGSTPLIIQCKNFSFYSEDNLKSFDCVKLLLDRGACVNVTDYFGSTPLHFATENELVDIMELLLEFGANPNVLSEIGDSPLHIAVRNQSLEVVFTLLEWGANMNMGGGTLGETPLDIAAQSLFMFNVWNYSSEVLVKHMAKLTSAGLDLPISDSNTILYKKMSSEFMRRCSEEVKKLSVTLLVAPYSYLDVLTVNYETLTKCVRNIQVEELFKLGDYITEFPLYSSLLSLRFRWGFERNYLLKKSYKYFMATALHLPRLPFDCFENICKYLTVPDLRSFAHASYQGTVGSRDSASCIICKGTVVIPKQKLSLPPGTKRFHLIKILNY